MDTSISTYFNLFNYRVPNIIINSFDILNTEEIFNDELHTYEKIVNDTFINDNRTEDIKQMYAERHAELKEALSKIIIKKTEN